MLSAQIRNGSNVHMPVTHEPEAGLKVLSARLKGHLIVAVWLALALLLRQYVHRNPPQDQPAPAIVTIAALHD